MNLGVLCENTRLGFLGGCKAVGGEELIAPAIFRWRVDRVQAGGGDRCGEGFTKVHVLLLLKCRQRIGTRWRTLIY